MYILDLDHTHFHSSVPTYPSHNASHPNTTPHLHIADINVIAVALTKRDACTSEH